MGNRDIDFECKRQATVLTLSKRFFFRLDRITGPYHWVKLPICLLTNHTEQTVDYFGQRYAKKRLMGFDTGAGKVL